MADLTVEALEATAFAPFGSVIAFEPAAARLVNEGTAWRVDTRALFDNGVGTAPVLALYRLHSQEGPLKLSVFERHPHSAQSFVSLDVAHFVVAVAPTGRDGLPILAAARAFVGRSGTGFSYRRDQWHTPVMALGPGGDVLMLMAERGAPDDCIEHRLAAPLTLEVLGPTRLESTTHGA